MKWLPKEVQGMDLAFGPKNIDEYLPKHNDIPDEFKKHRGNKWVDLFSDWFYFGLSKLEFTPKEGIDPDMATRHVMAIMKSWEPKHERKTAGCSYLMSEWFEDVEWERNKREEEV